MGYARKPLPTAALGALGVVFGDIGTSPLYALQQCVAELPGMAHDPAAVLGVLSLVLWAVILVVCVKYTGFVLRADHEGEGGALALIGLLRSRGGLSGLGPLTLALLFGAALLYGDGIVTPSISVLSAVEGLNVATDAFKPYVMPIALGILVALFLVQRSGTAKVGAVFGPILLVWFAAIGVLGAIATARHPGVLAAFNPAHAIAFLGGHGWTGYAVLGAVVLCISGVEALFADLGHFGRRPIILAWYCVVLPALALNYLGQGAMLIDQPDTAADNPFFALVPHWGIYPMVLLSTVATTIASQALISGAFSLTQQAVNMQFCPRLAVIHTSDEQSGQVYMPAVNILLMVGCVALVVGFGSSAALGAAYGLAVTGTMTLTSVAMFAVMRRVWRWPALVSGMLAAAFLAIDLAFLGANAAKILHGAWVPLLVGLVVFGVFLLWTDLDRRFTRALHEWGMPIRQFAATMKDWGERSDGTAVFLTRAHDEVPLVGRHEWLRRHVRQERVLLLRVDTNQSPYVRPGERLSLHKKEGGLYAGVVCFGFMQNPDLIEALKESPFPELVEDCDTMVFYLAKPFPTEQGGFLLRMRRQAYVLLTRLAQTPIEYFDIPPHQTVSLGIEISF